MDLPDFDKDRQLRSYNLQEQREYFRREGIPPVRTAEYKPLYIDASSKEIVGRDSLNENLFVRLAEPFEPYVPPEGDGKATLMSKDVNCFRSFEKFDVKL